MVMLSMENAISSSHFKILKYLSIRQHTDTSQCFFVDDNKNFCWKKLINFRHKDDDDDKNLAVFVDEMKTKTKIQVTDEDDD